jgi:hypothetical protein
MNVGIGQKNVDEKFKTSLEKCEPVVTGQKKNLLLSDQ